MPAAFDRETAARLLEYFARRRGDVLALTRALCEAESPSGDREGSRAVVRSVERAARSVPHVGAVERVEAANGYGEHLRVTAFCDGVKDERTLLILGHTDTVHPRGSLSARPWREEGGRIYAPGIFDMKAACAVALEALRACGELGLRPRSPVRLLLTCDEESGSYSGRALVEEEARRAEHVLVLEPPAPGGRAKTARKGTGLFTMTVRGRASHAGLEPEKGVSAVLELARQVVRLHSLADPSEGTTVSVGVISGGTHSNVVPAEARAEIDVRFSTAEEARRVEREIRGSAPFDERAQVEVSGGTNRPPLERTPAAAELYERARGIAEVLDFELGEASVGGASDGNFAAAAGAAVLDGLGVDGGGAHAEHEHILADRVAPRGALLAALIANL
ncbi:MAG TPA: M20/M25/M40 family metallo-hydrolase [Pyrinomonadaceae bacterium]|nr:M20/M25/M40 family metallo-hydrolase [Pyrinomonadaceae bacterium]